MKRRFLVTTNKGNLWYDHTNNLWTENPDWGKVNAGNCRYVSTKSQGLREIDSLPSKYEPVLLVRSVRWCKVYEKLEPYVIRVLRKFQ